MRNYMSGHMHAEYGSVASIDMAMAHRFLLTGTLIALLTHFFYDQIDKAWLDARTREAVRRALNNSESCACHAQIDITRRNLVFRRTSVDNGIFH